jgi:hypothetical protein
MSVRAHSDTSFLIDSLRLSYAVLAYRGREDMERPAYEVDSPYINAPSWPWALAGWTVSALHVVFFVVAWIHGPL